MRKIIYTSMLSLDGFIEGPDKELDWQIIDEELHRFVNDRERSIDTYLHGRKMYQLMASYWTTADTNPSSHDLEVEYSQIWKSIHKIVFSKTLDKVEGDARLMREVDAGEIQALKEQPGKDLGIGGADLASTFMRLGLIDEYHLYFHPAILGEGTRWVGDTIGRTSLKLVETHTFGSGVVYLRYNVSHDRNDPKNAQRAADDE